MENIILTNNKDLRLVGVKVGVYSTLRFELPLVSASATHVEVIVTSGDVHSAYTATFIEATKRWQCDIAASQFPAVGKQSYEVAYVLDGKQFWDGKGWIEIEDATTSGIEPQPRPEPYRYAVVSVNGYGADAQGAVRIPKTFIATNSPMTTEDYMEGDIYFNRLTGATWTLCNVLGTLTWVFNYKNYYTKSETEEAIDKIAAYYITYNAAGAAFPTRDALINAMAYYSGGELRVPTRNDYAVVLADESHGGAEWRYIYAVADGQTTGQWEAQYPIETNDYDALANKPSVNGVTLTGNKSADDLGLATKAEADALRAGKANRASNPTAGNLATLDANGNPVDSGKKPSDFQSALSNGQLANIAAVSDALAFDATHSYAAGDPVVYNGTLYTFTAAHTGAWTGSDVSAVDIIARLAGKLDKRGGMVTGDFTFGSGQTALRQDIYGIYVQDAQGDTWFLYDSDTPNTVARLANIPYSPGAPTVIDTASSETVEGETVNYGAATLANRTANIVQVTAATALDELRITFPAATSGKVRDFGLRVEIGTGSAALAAPALVPIAPTGETIKIENNAAEIPALADGTATAKGVTLLYFSENAPGVFVVKGEQVKEVA